MTTRNLTLNDEIQEYVSAHGSGPDQLIHELIAETRASLPHEAMMQVAPEQAGLLTLLTQIAGARHAVEVGTFTGLSSLAIARGLADGGKLICCDVSAEFTSIAQRYWERAGLGDRIELRLGPAADTLAAMPAEPHIDLSFIDADKVSYPRYWAEIVPRMRPGGVIIVDNVLRDGRVVNPEPDDTEARAVADFNELVLGDDRVDSVMIPLADGITIARRR